MAGLRLEAVEFVDLNRWRWVLTDESTETAIADHEVRLESSRWQFEAFEDLVGYLSWHATPDRRAKDEARIVAELGEWIGSQVLGPVGDAMVQATPVTVRVAVPEGAAELLARPLELAHIGGKPLAIQGVTLVMETGSAAGTVRPVGARLRVLGLFSLPEGGQALNLRRERQSLVQLFEGIAVAGKAADVRVLQYGVTRDRLRDVLADEEGWDVIHVSGHGSPGHLLLETGEGRPDRVSEAELAELLGPARGRLKLVTVSACWSAAVAIAEQRRLLDLPVTTETAPERISGSRDAEPSPGSLAAELSRRLGCAVLAMRYPVDDEFAITLSGRLYELLVDKGSPLPLALGITLRDLASISDDAEPGGTAFPALSLATPALFGSSAIDLRLSVPDCGHADGDGIRNPKMAGFPPQSERFVGRTGVMARASAALAAESGIPGVLLHGMPGGGKTACALELAYGHEHAFDRLLWYKAPDEGMDITGTLTDFALTLERYLVGFQMAHVLVSEDHLTAFLPQLTELMEQRHLMIVIDNAESLLTEDGRWRDEHWGAVILALTTHTGPGRLILTSRRSPAGLIGARVETVDTLSADEALLLTRELPHLDALSRGDIPGIEHYEARRLARRALDVARGHPKLLELAEGQAAHPDRLAELIETGGQAWRKLGRLPDGFFATGETGAAPADYLVLLADWTQAATGTLAADERDLFWFLCCLEEHDRERPLVEIMWPFLRNQLGRDSQPLDIEQALVAITDCGLATIQTGADKRIAYYAIHPGVAAAGRADAGKTFQNAVDNTASDYWHAMHIYASGETEDGTVHTGLLVRAGLAATPYMIRQGQWTDAARLLERAFLRDPSRRSAAVALPAIEQITSHDPSQADLLAMVMEVLNPAAAEAHMTDLMVTAVVGNNYILASTLAGRLSDRCMRDSRLAEALAFADQQIDYARRARLGPWTQLGGEILRLQVLNKMGQASHVLDQVHRLHDRIKRLPSTPAPNESVTPWNAREILFDVGEDAAIQLGRWDEALGMNAAQIASMRARRAPASDIARASSGTYFPLLRLGRLDDARDLLLACRQAFEDAHDIGGLGHTISALADIEAIRGHVDVAIRLELDALRYKYLAEGAEAIATTYHNLGLKLRILAHQAALAVPFHLTAALVRVCAGIGGTGIGSSDDSVHQVGDDLRELGTRAVLPRDVADLCRQVGDIPGTDLPGLITRLSPDPETAEQALRDVIAQAQALAGAPTRNG